MAAVSVGADRNGFTSIGGSVGCNTDVWFWKSFHKVHSGQVITGFLFGSADGLIAISIKSWTGTYFGPLAGMVTYWIGPLLGALLASLTCSFLAKKITIAKLYHFDSDRDGLLRRSGSLAKNTV